MKFLNYLKTNFIIYMKQSHKLVFSYLAMPILLSIFLSFTSGSAFSVEPKAPKIKVNIENKDRGQIGKVLDKYFASLAASNIIVKTDKNDADYNIYVDENYGQSLLDKNSQGKIRLEGKTNASLSQKSYLKLMLEEINTKLQEEKIIEKLAADKNISARELNSILETLTKAEADIAFKINLVDGSRAVNGRQYFSIVSIGYVLLMIFATAIQANVKPEFKGLGKRLSLLPFKHYQKVLYSLFTDSLLYMGLLVLYIVCWRVIDSSTFEGNLILYFVILSVFTLFIVSLASFLSLFLNESRAALVSSVTSIGYLVFSGFLPLDKISANPLFVWLATNPLKRILIDPFFNVLRGEGIAKFLPVYLVILGLVVMINFAHLKILGAREEGA